MCAQIEYDNGAPVAIDWQDNGIECDFPELYLNAEHEERYEIDHAHARQIAPGRWHAPLRERAPFVGMGATLCYYSDRHAGTIIAISKSGRKITIREDRAVRTDNNGMSDCQDYSYTDDPDGRVHVCYRQSDGTYKSSQGPRVTLGVRRSYHDYSF